MSKPKIEKPKIFISYAWGSDEYQNKVLSFATDLIDDGIDVQLDKWDLREGNDTYAFMEKSVIDPSITNVLILLDENYGSKADSRSGGVGTETQIISPEIYNKVSQEKFIPVVFERGTNGEVCKPVYLKNLLHFDLSIDEKYNFEYQRLVKRLFGVEIYRKPEIGNKPLWLDETHTISTKTRSEYSVLKSNQSSRTKNEQFNIFLLRIKDDINNFKKDEDLSFINDNKYIELYADTKIIRDEYLQLLNYISNVDNAEQYIANILEEIINLVHQDNTLMREIKLTLIHEMYIYLIASYYKKNNYEALAYTLGKTYFKDIYLENNISNFNIFYHNNTRFDNAIRIRDDKRYYSGTAQYWIENINTEVCSKNEFIFADLLCFNYSIFGKDYHYHWYWFPLTYCYNGNISFFANRLKSMEWLKKALTIFGYDNVDEFKLKITEIDQMIKEGKSKRYRFDNAFENAPMLIDYIKSDEIGIWK